MKTDIDSTVYYGVRHAQLGYYNLISWMSIEEGSVAYTYVQMHAHSVAYEGKRM